MEKIGKQISNVHLTGPRQVYVKALIEEVQAQRGVAGPAAFAVRQFVFKHHSQMFSELGPGQVAALHTGAAAFSPKKLEHLWECRDHVAGRITMLRARHAESALDGFVNHMVSIRFDPVIMQGLQSCGLSMKHVLTLPKFFASSQWLSC